jgi:uncharacterized protein (TIGR02117 family)
MFKKLLRTLAYTLEILLLFLLLYFMAAVGLSKIPVNADFDESAEGIDVYLLTNGVHTDIVLPLKNEIKDWSIEVDPVCTKSGCPQAKYVAFGWGDKGFYLNTPTWGDLKFSTAFKALFWLSTSAMHITFYNGMKQSSRCIKIRISEKSYRDIITYIEKSFYRNPEGKFEQIKNAAYGEYDSFYEANGTYNLFFTCNTWTNACLKAGKMRACTWAAFDQSILDQYK